MSIVATSAERVPRHTSAGANARIARTTTERLARIGNDQAAIATRLRELDREWDVERTIQANAATLALAGTVLGVSTDRRFLVIPAVVTTFLLQHALQGWCPPLPVLRRLGFRTPREIEDERHTLLQRAATPPRAEPSRRKLTPSAARGRSRAVRSSPASMRKRRSRSA